MLDSQENTQPSTDSLADYLKELRESIVINDSTEGAIAQEILNRKFSITDMIETDNLKERAVFKNWEEARPGIVPFENDDLGESGIERECVANAKCINDSFVLAESPWRAWAYHYGEDEAGIILNARINEHTMLYQEISNFEPFNIIDKAQSKRSGFIWETNRFIMSSLDTGEVINLNVLMGSDMMPFAKNKVYEVLGEPVDDNHANYLSDTFVENIYTIYDVFTLFHEIGHAKEFSLSNADEKRVLGIARGIYNMGAGEKILYEKNRKESQLSVEDAHKITVRQERLAWAYAYRILKEINEKCNFQFGDYNDRERLRLYAESCLKSYDNSFIVLPFIKDNNIPLFSQEGRGKARNLEAKINKGQISRDRAFRKTFGVGSNTKSKPVNVANIYN